MCTLLFFVYSCQTESLDTSELPEAYDRETVEENIYGFEVNVENGILSFPSREDYDLAIEYLGALGTDAFVEFENNLGFASMRSTMSKESREKIGIYDNLLAVLINGEGIINISGNIFSLNALEETVTMSSSKDFDKVSKSSKGDRVFSTNDNILNILEGTDTQETAKRHYCRSNKKGPYNLPIAGVGVKFKIVYQRAGFLNALVANLKKNQYGGRVDLNLQSVGSNFWRNKTSNRPISYYSDGGGHEGVRL